jgi:hypothetical protein
VKAGPSQGSVHPRLNRSPRPPIHPAAASLLPGDHPAAAAAEGRTFPSDSGRSARVPPRWHEPWPRLVVPLVSRWAAARPVHDRPAAHHRAGLPLFVGVRRCLDEPLPEVVGPGRCSTDGPASAPAELGQPPAHRGRGRRGAPACGGAGIRRAHGRRGPAAARHRHVGVAEQLVSPVAYGRAGGDADARADDHGVAGQLVVRDGVRRPSATGSWAVTAGLVGIVLARPVTEPPPTIDVARVGPSRGRGRA